MWTWGVGPPLWGLIGVLVWLVGWIAIIWFGVSLLRGPRGHVRHAPPAGRTGRPRGRRAARRSGSSERRARQPSATPRAWRSSASRRLRWVIDSERSPRVFSRIPLATSVLRRRFPVMASG